jgi:hypothetical protein
MLVWWWPWWGCVGVGAKVGYCVLVRRSFPRKLASAALQGKSEDPRHVKPQIGTPHAHYCCLDNCAYHFPAILLPFLARNTRQPFFARQNRSPHIPASPPDNIDTRPTSYLLRHRTNAGLFGVWWLQVVLSHEQAVAAMSALLTDRQAEEL